MDVLIVEDDQEQLDGIESILLEKPARKIRSYELHKSNQLPAGNPIDARKQNPTIPIGYLSWR